MCLSLDLAAESLLFMTSRKASQHVLLMAALVAMPDGSWEAACGVQTPLWTAEWGRFLLVCAGTFLGASSVCVCMYACMCMCVHVCHGAVFLRVLTCSWSDQGLCPT